MPLRIHADKMELEMLHCGNIHWLIVYNLQAQTFFFCFKKTQIA